METWRPVREFPSLFEVSNRGNIRSFPRTLRDGRRWPARDMIPKNAGSGHMHIRLCADRHYWRLVHRLVLEAFVGPCPDGMEACHNNGIPADNRLENLRWDTRSNNNRDKHAHGTALIGTRNPLAKLTPNSVLEIRKQWSAGKSGVSLAKQYKVTPANISAITRRQTWQHI